MTPCYTYLKASNPLLNVNRWYSLTIMKDLFGDWLLITQWGRQGFKGQFKQYAFKEESALHKAFQSTLKKRLTSHKRIGCNYEIVKEE